jgi:hypothetical protein
MGYEMKDCPQKRLHLNYILLRRLQDVNISLQDVKCYKSSLHAFVELFVLKTVYVSDSVPLELFTQHYENVCVMFHIEKVRFELDYLRTEFRLESSVEME